MRRETPAGVLVLPCDAPRVQWLTARRHGITATDIVAIAGLSQYRNAHDVWLDKRTPVVDTGPSEAAYWGHLLEEPVAAEWARRQGVRVRRVGLLRHHKVSRHLATCDRIVVARQAVLEVKTRSAFVSDRWDDGIPDDVTAQAQWQLHVTGYETAHVAALVGGQTLRAYTVQRDQDVIDYLVGLADELWEQVPSDTPPRLEPHLLRQESLDRLYPSRAGAAQVDAIECAELVAAYRRASREASEAEKARKEAGMALQQLVGDAEVAMVGEREAFSYRQARPSWKATDVRRMADVIPEAVACGFIHETPGSRRLHIPKDPA